MVRKKLFTLCCLFFVTAILMAAGLFSYMYGYTPVTLIPVDSREEIDIPIIMYHGITETPYKESEYIVSAVRFENDLKWLNNNGYTTILPSQLISYVKEGTSLPSKPVILSFDDGFANNYTLAFPLLKKYNAKAVVAIIGSESDISSGTIYKDQLHSNLSWGEIAIMADSGLVEFANHSYSLHAAPENGRKGADMLPGENFEQYRQILLKDLGKNQTTIEEPTGVPPQVFAWPYGAYPSDRCADSVLKELGFEATFVSYQHTSTVKAGYPESLYGLGRYLRTPDFDINKITVGHL